jgi:cytoskeletal protein CcmA (bactofilin family)
MQVPSEKQHSMIGKSIVIKGEITASDPLFVYGRVEGSIKAPAQRVTVGKEGKLKASVSAREVVIMGQVHGNIDGGHRVEVRAEGSVTGDLAAERVLIEDGAILKGIIDVRLGAAKDKVKAQEESDSDMDSTVEVSTEESELESESWASAAAS